jgi:hypothetical protein
MLLTVEQQLHYCGCLIALILGLVTLSMSIFTIIYSFKGWREYDLKLYSQDIIEWQEVEFIAFQNASASFDGHQMNQMYTENEDSLVSKVD